MERPIFKPVGTPVDQLDTPALVVDLASLERNIDTLHSFFRQHEAKVRPHVESHRCPAIAHKQLAAGGTVGGICVGTVGQAEVFAEHGFTDILVANEVVSSPKIGRLCALAHHANMTVAVDQAQNVQDLSSAASTQGVTLHVMVEIHTRGQGCGIEPGQPALELAKRVEQAPHLEFVGLMTREGPTSRDDAGKFAGESQQWVQKVLDTRQMAERAGFTVHRVSVGGTYNYEIAGAMAGVTEVLAGTYALMDACHIASRPQFIPAASVLATVTSRPEPGTAIVDAGQKAVGIDAGLPLVQNLPGVTAVSWSAEHGRLQLPDNMDSSIALADKVYLTPWDIGTCANLYDYMHAIRDVKLEAVWDVAARGHYR